jgi:hypothetical protein
MRLWLEATFKFYHNCSAMCLQRKSGIIRSMLNAHSFAFFVCLRGKNKPDYSTQRPQGNITQRRKGRTTVNYVHFFAFI